MNKEEIQNKIDQLEKELNKLKNKMIKSEKWEPYKNGYYIDGNGYCYEVEGLGYRYPAANNCFRTKVLAEYRAHQREVEDELFNIWEYLVGDWRPNWGDKSPKYVMIINNHETFDTILNAPIMPIYRYFPSQKLAQKQYELASDHARSYLRGEF